MDIILTKKQLNLLREFGADATTSQNNKPAADVSNTEGDNDVSSLRSDAEEVSQAQGANSMNKSINVQSYTNKNIPKANANQTMTIPVGNGSVGQAATKAQDTILHTPDNSLPGKIILTQGRKINGKLVEVTTFKKNELDKFLKSL
jgi:hypothetical protein